MLQKSVNENFETSPIVTRVTPSIIAPFSLRRSNLAESKYLRAENYAASTGCRWFNRGARSRRVRLACETEALNDSGHLSYERSAPPFTISSIQHRYCPADRSRYRTGYLGHSSHTWPHKPFCPFSLFLAVCFFGL